MEAAMTQIPSMPVAPAIAIAPTAEAQPTQQAPVINNFIMAPPEDLDSYQDQEYDEQE